MQSCRRPSVFTLVLGSIYHRCSGSVRFTCFDQATIPRMWKGERIFRKHRIHCPCTRRTHPWEENTNGEFQQFQVVLHKPLVHAWQAKSLADVLCFDMHVVDQQEAQFVLVIANVCTRTIRDIIRSVSAHLLVRLLQVIVFLLHLFRYGGHNSPIVKLHQKRCHVVLNLSFWRADKYASFMDPSGF